LRLKIASKEKINDMPYNEAEPMERFYRNTFNTVRFASFTLQYRDTDLWIGVDHESFSREMAELLLNEVVELWQCLEGYTQNHPEFKTSHTPVALLENAPQAAILMAEAGSRAGTGPMAAVAGFFAWHTGEILRQKFGAKEIVVENGGDFYLFLEKDLTMTIYAGNSPLTDRIALVVPASATPCGVCTSSGTVGHSFSYGKADAVMIACRSPLLADAWATSLANRVQSPDDIAHLLNVSENFPEIESIIAICEDKVGIRGNFDTKFINK
jgi:uncharacterized protein